MWTRAQTHRHSRIPLWVLSVSCYVSDFALMFSIERGWCVCRERRKEVRKGNFNIRFRLVHDWKIKQLHEYPEWDVVFENVWWSWEFTWGESRKESTLWSVHGVVTSVTSEGILTVEFVALPWIESRLSCGLLAVVIDSLWVPWIHRKQWFWWVWWRKPKSMVSWMNITVR